MASSISVLDLLFAKALAAGLARELMETEEPPENFFRVPTDPKAWEQIDAVHKRDNMVFCMEITHESRENCKRTQSVFMDLAREFEQIPFFRVSIEPENTFDELRKDLGGVQYTPTFLVVFYKDDGKIIAKYEGHGEIKAAIESGRLKEVIKQFIGRREALRATKKLVGQMLLLKLLQSGGDDEDDQAQKKELEAQQEYDSNLRSQLQKWEKEPPKRPDTAEARFELKFSDLYFKPSDKVGQGSFGIVYKGRWKSTTVAIKKVMNFRKEEVAVLRSLDHPNIIKLHGVCYEPGDNTYIVTEFADNGNVMDYIEKREGKPEKEKSLRWAKEIAEGMKYLHLQDFAHRDLKSANVLLTDKWVVKICDFGTSRDLTPSTLMNTQVGTLPYMAPEIIENQPFSKSCDIYSYGILLWELVTYRKPYKTANGKPFSISGVLKGERPKLPDASMCTGKLRDLMQQCWNTKPKERPPFATIVLVLS